MRIAIAGYGNLGRGVEAAALGSQDVELMGIFTRRDPGTVVSESGQVPVLPLENIEEYKEEIDVLVICTGSANDLPEMTPELASMFNVVDSFDNHAEIPAHFGRVDIAARDAGTTAVISAGWDPGLFSLGRILSQSILPSGNTYTFWGRGVSQGHSAAIRRIPGVSDAKQYTVPSEAAMDSVRNHENKQLTAQEMHLRECFVVAKDGADREEIRQRIVNMPDYFKGYETTVQFISQQEFDSQHRGLPHGGSVIRTGTTVEGSEFDNRFELTIDLDSNPYFTGSVLLCVARAAFRMNQEGSQGCYTMLDIPPSYYSSESSELLRATLL